MINLKKVELKKIDKIKLAWFSNHITHPTGYGKVTREITSRLSKDPLFEVHLIGEGGNENGTTKWNNCILWGVGGNPNDFMKNTVSILDLVKPDVLMFLEDTFTLGNFGFPLYHFPCKVGMYCPQDGNGIPDMGLEVMRNLDFIVPMSSFSKQVCEREQFKTENVIWHGVDLNQFSPVSKTEQAKLKEKFGFKPNDYIIYNYGRNSARKNNQTMIQALCEFLKDKSENVKAFLHIMNPNINEANMYSFLSRYMTIETGKNLLGKQIIINDKGSDPKNPLSDGDVADSIKMCDMVISSCFHPDTDIITRIGGSKKIKDIQINDMVLSKDGRFNKISNKFEYDYNGNLLEIKTHYNIPIRLTPEHKVFAIKNPSINRKGILNKIKRAPQKYIEEIKADYLREGDYLLLPRAKETLEKEILNYLFHTGSGETKDFDVKETEDYMWLRGFYLAEGCLSQNKKRGTISGIIFSVNSNEKEYTKKVLRIMKKETGLNGTVKDSSRNRRTISFYSRSLAEHFNDMFGSGAQNKKIPWFYQFLPHNLQQALIKGLWDGDGSKYISKLRTLSFDYQTTSKTLAEQMRLILTRLGWMTTLTKQKRQSIVYRIRISGNQNFEDLLKLEIKREKNRKTFNRGFVDDAFFYVPIYSIKKEKYSGKIYDLGVEDDHSYTTLSFCGHNSIGEGFGLLMSEAMAAGKPIVHAGYSTPEELLTTIYSDNIGLRGITVNSKVNVVSSYNVEHGFIEANDLAKAMNEIYFNKELSEEISRNGRNFAEKHFDWDQLVWGKDGWIDVIKRNI